MAQKISVGDTEQEYIFQISEAKKLYEEWQQITPEDFRLRLKQKITYLADLLETIGVPDHKIVGKILSDLEGIYSERHIRRLLDNPKLEEKTDMMSGIISSTPADSHEEENNQMIDLCDRVIAFQQNLRKKLSENPYESLLDVKILQEHLYSLNNLIDTAEECLDERETAVEVSHHMLFCEIVREGTAHAAETFQTKVKTLKLTPKQTTNYRLGQVRRLHPLYDPHDEEDAITSPSKFYGVKCAYQHCQKCEHNNKLSAAVCTWCNSTEVVKQGCGSWRVKIGNQADAIYTVHCFACQADFKPTTKPLPRTNNEMTVNVIMQSPFTASTTVNPDLGFTATTTAVTKL